MQDLKIFLCKVVLVFLATQATQGSTNDCQYYEVFDDGNNANGDVPRAPFYLQRATYRLFLSEGSSRLPGEPLSIEHFTMETGILDGTVVCEKDIGRRRTVPVIYVSGSHYDVGFDTGRTFSSIIKSFIATCDRLRDFEEQYKTAAGKEAFDTTLANMKTRYPWYLKEIQGVADGAKVPFYQLFLLQLDDIIETINENNIVRNDTGGCSSIGINNPINSVLGHTEDAFSETLNHFYILSAHVIPTPEDKELGAKEERFSSLCYAGQLPGYTSGFNEYGMVFSINTLSPRNLKPGNTPRTFITRALLAATSPADAERIIQDDGLGAGNGFSLNLLWTEASGRTNMFNIEVAPNLQANRSLLSVRKYENGGETLAHVNRYQRIPVPEVRGPIIDSSVARMNQIKAHSAPAARRDVEDILSDQTGKEYRVFQDSKEAIVVTITAGIFDLNARTWSLYINKPNGSEPIAVLPIVFNKLSLY